MRNETIALFLGLAVVGCGGPHIKQPSVAWHHDDWDGAVAAARADKKPLVVDLWAPWCHTCLSMKSTVLADPAIAALGDRFVWLSIDTDRPQNAAAVAKLPIEFWPTFFVLDAEDATVEARQVGSATVDQFREFLRRGEAGYLDARAGRTPADDPLRFVREGDRAAQAGDAAAADAAYAQAFAHAPADWSRAPEVLVAWIGARADHQDWDGCVALGEQRLDEAARGHTGSAGDFASLANDCAEHVAPDRAKAFRERAAKMLNALASDPAAPLSIDDRSEAWRILREVETSLGDEAAAHAAAVAQRDLLAKAFATAPDPMVAMTYGWPRAEVAVYLGEGEKLVPDLQKNMAALPDQYDPPYRLAWVLLKLNRLDEARTACQAALQHAYGPRKGRIYKLLADIEGARRDVAAQRAALQAWVDAERGLPEGQRDPKRLAQAEAALAAVH